MEGKALIWFQELRSSNNLISWNEILKAIRVRFGKGSYDEPMETLTKLQQFGLLEEYKSQFEVLANRVHDLPEHHKLSYFLGRLNDGDQGTASKDLVQVPIEPVTRARAKKFKDVLNGLIQELWAQANS
jgi:hypothetical protein